MCTFPKVAQVCMGLIGSPVLQLPPQRPVFLVVPVRRKGEDEEEVRAGRRSSPGNSVCYFS